MDRAIFSAQLHEAAARAHDFAQRHLIERLPKEVRLRISLNASYDGNPLAPDEQVFPLDHQTHPPATLSRLSCAEAAALLWRDGAVPEWIDVSVVDEDGEITVLELVCCGRFTRNESYYYYRDPAGRPSPFGVKGPALPPDAVPSGEGGEGGEIAPFSLHWSAGFTDPAELSQLARIGAHLISLGLHGAGFDDATLARLGGLPALSSLTLHGTAVRGDGLGALAATPLQHLGLREVGRAPLDLAPAAALRGLRSLSIEGAADRVRGLGAVAGLPELSSLTLRAPGVEGLPALAPLAQLTSLDLDDSQVHDLEPLTGLPRLRSLNLARTRVTDAALAALRGLSTLQTLDLRETAVTDMGMSHLCALPNLRKLWIGGTGVTEKGAATLRTAPRLKHIYS